VRGQTADAGDSGEPPHRPIGLGHGDDLGLDGGAGGAQLVDLLQHQAQYRQQHRRDPLVAGRDALGQLGEAAPPRRRNDAELGQLTAHAVDQLGVLPDQQFARPFEPARGLARDALDRDKAHVRTADRGADRCRIARVVLVAPDERLDVSRRDQAHIVTQRAQLARPVMGRAARLDPNQRRIEPGEKRQDLRSPQPLLHNDLAARILAVNLEHRLRDIQPDRVTLHQDGLRCWRSFRPQLGTSDAVRRPSTQHCERSEAISLRRCQAATEIASSPDGSSQ
jgi:hypothetical protein